MALARSFVPRRSATPNWKRGRGDSDREWLGLCGGQGPFSRGPNSWRCAGPFRGVCRYGDSSSSQSAWDLEPSWWGPFLNPLWIGPIPLEKDTQGHASLGRPLTNQAPGPGAPLPTRRGALRQATPRYGASVRRELQQASSALPAIGSPTRSGSRGWRSPRLTRAGRSRHGTRASTTFASIACISSKASSRAMRAACILPMETSEPRWCSSPMHLFFPACRKRAAADHHPGGFAGAVREARPLRTDSGALWRAITRIVEPPSGARARRGARPRPPQARHDACYGAPSGLLEVTYPILARPDSHSR